MLRSATILCAAAVTLVACVPLPIPYKATVVPGLHGRVTKQSSPISGVRIGYSIGAGACAEPQYETVSDSDGRFAFPHEWTWRPVVLPLVPFNCVTQWSLCIQLAGAEARSWTGHSCGLPPALTIECEVDRADPGYRNRDMCRHWEHEAPPNQTLQPTGPPPSVLMVVLPGLEALRHRGTDLRPAAERQVRWAATGEYR